MGLFNRKDTKKSRDQLAALDQDRPGKNWITDDEPLGPGNFGSLVNYETVLGYMVGLSNQDYQTICKVADIYRKANNDAAKVRGIPVVPTSFIEQPIDDDTKDDLAIAEILDEGDRDKEAAFIPTEPKKIAVKD